MTVNGISGVNGGVQTGHLGGIVQMDSVSKSIQSQIANVKVGGTGNRIVTGR